MDAIVTGNRHIYMRFQYPAMFNIHPDRWYAPAKWLFPKEAVERTKFSDIARDYSEKRMASGDEDRQDIMSALLAAQDPKTGERLTDAEIWGEAHLMIAAGMSMMLPQRGFFSLTKFPRWRHNFHSLGRRPLLSLPQ